MTDVEPYSPVFPINGKIPAGCKGGRFGSLNFE